MKRITENLGLLAAVVYVMVAVASCKSERVEQADSFSSMDDFFDQNKQEEQEFVVDTGGTGPIIGKMGTRLYGDSSIFMLPGGGDVAYPFMVKLIELYPRKDIILYRTPTVSGGAVLRSGGEIRARAYKNGQELVLRPNRAFMAEMPTIAPETGMQVYYGPNVDVPVDWSLSTDNSTITNITGYYQAVIYTMGWINCDRLYNYTGAKTTMAFTVDGSGTENIALFVVFRNFLSVLKVNNLTSTEVPIGESVTVIAMAKDQNGKFRLHNSSETISAGFSIKLDMKEVTEQQLLDALTAL